METDLHRIIYSRQELSDEHVQYFVYQVRSTRADDDVVDAHVEEAASSRC